jgi:hypothetical protein
MHYANLFAEDPSKEERTKRRNMSPMLKRVKTCLQPYPDSLVVEHEGEAIIHNDIDDLSE